MEKYKICPCCDTKNAPAMLECMNCEADLSNVKITDEETEKMLAEQETAQSTEPQSKFVRVCECGEKNPPNARKCSKCNEEIFDILPTPDKQEEKTITFVLSSVDGQFTYKVTAETVVIGRENAMCEYLSIKSYVSRSHANLLLENGELFIENLSNTNFTYVNQKKITEKTKLQDGDEIGLGGTKINGKYQDLAAYFIVKVC